MDEVATTMSSRPALAGVSMATMGMIAYWAESVGRRKSKSPSRRSGRQSLVQSAVTDSVNPVRLSTIDYRLPCDYRPSTCAFRLLRVRFLRIQHDAVAGELLHDRKEAGVEEADLEEHEERQCSIDAVGKRVEDRGCEVEPETRLDERLHRDRLPIPFGRPLVAVALDPVLRRPGELGLLVEQRFEHRLGVVDGQADADGNQKRHVAEARDPVTV